MGGRVVGEEGGSCGMQMWAPWGVSPMGCEGAVHRVSGVVVGTLLALPLAGSSSNLGSDCRRVGDGGEMRRMREPIRKSSPPQWSPW